MSVEFSTDFKPQAAAIGSVGPEQVQIDSLKRRETTVSVGISSVPHWIRTEMTQKTVSALVDLYHTNKRPDWNLFALTATIEVERHRNRNPSLPEWLSDDYKSAWRRLNQLALVTLGSSTDPETVQSALAVLAIAHGNLKLGALIIHLDSSGLDEILQQYLVWNEGGE